MNAIGREQNILVEMLIVCCSEREVLSAYSIPFTELRCLHCRSLDENRNSDKIFISVILFLKTGYKVDHKTVKRIRCDILHQKIDINILHKTYHDHQNLYEARVEMIKLYYQGWFIKSISQFLEISKTTVYTWIKGLKRMNLQALLKNRRNQKALQQFLHFPQW